MTEKKERLGPRHPDWVWLRSPDEVILAERAQPFDSKTDKWIPDPTQVYIKAKIKAENGDKFDLESSEGKAVTLPKVDVLDCNPPKFEKEEDMSNLSILNRACILHNLRTRYMVLQIYTYSGLFCICINPYKWLNVYTQIMRDFYRNKRRNEAPPHLYAIADCALQFLELEKKNQSSLITGESGAGKTENTKKVLQYYAMNCADPKAAKSKADSSGKLGSLEDQIVQANPPMEAYGNAKTVRNNNSSRFGKFIRIHFGPTNKIAAADIETYLLEKSRITFQLEIERNYHIFYQFMSSYNPDYHRMCLLGQNPNPGDFYFLSQGVLTVKGIDDKEEMKATDEAFDVLGFSQEEKDGLYKGTMGIAFLGNSKWKQKGREEQAEPDGQEEVTNAATLLGVDPELFVDTLMKPKLKVGKDFVKKGQNKDQVAFSISATSKSLYARMFDWLVEVVNKTLDTPNPRKHFVGILDIAGFEIFELNVLEQLLINFTNERLQQFFNHTMFVQEQEEYKAEGIQWDFIDFGMDLAATIDLIEKKMGILAILEEECIVPKATDKTFLEKLMGKHLGKNPKMGKPKPAKKGKPEAHFELSHYAGVVGYNVTGWLFKNKDPVNEAMVMMMQEATNPVVSLVFQEQDGKKKGSSMMTISAGHRESLTKLMTNLMSTHPHFVRCIIPNEVKQSGLIDAPLVMHQLTCNGVLEGIRICQLGLPNKVIYSDYMTRYSVISPTTFAKLADDPKACAEKSLAEAGLNADNFRCGLTKVMFRAGKLADLEDIREERLSAIMKKLQSHVRKLLVNQIVFAGKVKEKFAIAAIQRNIRIYYQAKDWQWYQYYTTIKNGAAKIKKQIEEEDRRKLMQEGFEKFQAVLEQTTKEREEKEKENEEKKDTMEKLKSEMEIMASGNVELLSTIEALGARIRETERGLTETESFVCVERRRLEKEAEEEKSELIAQKEAIMEDISIAREKWKMAEEEIGSKRLCSLSMTSKLSELRREISASADEAGKLDTKATNIIRDKRDMWRAIEDLQRDFSLAVRMASASGVYSGSVPADPAPGPSPSSPSSSPSSSSLRRDVIDPDMALLSVAQRHYISSMLFDAQFGSQLRKKITNIIYNRRPTLVRNAAMDA